VSGRIATGGGDRRSAGGARRPAPPDPSGPARAARLKDIAAAVQLDRGTVHRLLSTMAEVGLVEQDRGNKCYRLGLELFALATAASNRYDVQDVARASLRRLAEETGDTILFYLRAAGDGVCVDLETGDYPVKTLPVDIGGRFPLGFGAAGLALLAPLPDCEIEQIATQNRARMTRFDPSACETMPEAIGSYRKLGFAYSDRNGAPGIASVAVPILDRRGRPVAAIGIASIVERLGGERRTALAGRLAREVAIISEALMRRPDALWQRHRWVADAPASRHKVASGL
jgi:DNA-binding IclR family transcriptional regulator